MKRMVRKSLFLVVALICSGALLGKVGEEGLLGGKPDFSQIIEAINRGEEIQILLMTMVRQLCIRLYIMEILTLLENY